MRFTSSPCVRRFSSLLGAALTLLACGSRSPSSLASGAASAQASAVVVIAGNALPERAEAVASADAWAVQGTKQGGPAGTARLLDAGVLRERIFRVDHREADALE